jgi:RNA polymerase sigma-70 factor (ECF subfamily)
MNTRAESMAETRTGATSFQELLDRHRKIVFKVANTYARNAEDRADLAQEIAAQAWRAFPGYDAQRLFSTWLYRIALNVAISFVRGAACRDRHSVALDESLHDVAGDSEPESDERVRALYRFIGQLDALSRALLLLYLEERSYREIADILGISETNVATKISRLKQRIRADVAADNS